MASKLDNNRGENGKINFTEDEKEVLRRVFGRIEDVPAVIEELFSPVREHLCKLGGCMFGIATMPVKKIKFATVEGQGPGNLLIST